MPLRKRLKSGKQKTAHVGYVKLIYHMLVLFEVLSLYLFLNTHSGAVHQKLSYEGSFFTGERSDMVFPLVHLLGTF